MHNQYLLKREGFTDHVRYLLIFTKTRQHLLSETPIIFVPYQPHSFFLYEVEVVL